MALPEPDSPRWNSLPLRDAIMAWRIEKVSVEQIESVPMFDRDVPLDRDNAAWVSLKGQVQPGDELWTFDSPSGFWRQGRGLCGIVLVRKGLLKEVCVLGMS